MFVDQVKLKLSAGKGGDGIIAWRREKYLPKGGPAGGNGGRGGSIYIRASHDVYSLEKFRHIKMLAAESGGAGGPSQQQGKSGKDLYLEVPLGTILREISSRTVLFDFQQEGQVYLLCQGGKGGKGNAFFKSSLKRAPHFCTPGEPGEEIEVELELKLIADIGLVGMPNAGKSTLFSKLAHTEVKTAPYPFTTLIPQLGFLSTSKKLLLADLPGIISGAHENKGLGLAFLKHIERTSALIFVLDLVSYEGKGPIQDFELLKEEIHHYNSKILKKPLVVALNKIEELGAPLAAKKFQEKYPDLATFLISAKKGIGLEPLQKKLEEIFSLLPTSKPPSEFSLLLQSLEKTTSG